MAFGRSVVVSPDTQRIFIATRGRHRAAFGETAGDAGDAWNRVLSSVGNRGGWCAMWAVVARRVDVFRRGTRETAAATGAHARERDDDGDDRARERDDARRNVARKLSDLKRRRSVRERSRRRRGEERGTARR